MRAARVGKIINISILINNRDFKIYDTIVNENATQQQHRLCFHDSRCLA